MANKTKLTTETYGTFKTFFEMGLPMRIIAEAMDINPVTASKYLEIMGRDDFEIVKGTHASQLRMLELYSSWVSDPQSYGLLGAGTKKDLLGILWRELNLEKFLTFVMGVLATGQITNNLTFSDDVTEQERMFLSDWYARFNGAFKSTRIRGKEMVTNIMQMLQNGTLPFPTANELAKRMSCYEKWTVSFISEMKKGVAPFITREVCDQAKEMVFTLPDRKVAALEYSYQMGWRSDLDYGQYAFSSEQARSIKKKAFENLSSSSRFAGIIFDLKSQQDIVSKHRKKILLLEQENEEKSVSLESATVENNSLQATIAFLRPKVTLTPDEQSAIGENQEAIDEIMKAPRFSILTKSIDDMDLSVRAYNCLKAAKVHFMFELVTLSVDDLLKLRNVGKKSAYEITEILREKEFSFDTVLSYQEERVFVEHCYPNGKN